jgi:hypothetical protein
LVFLVVVGGCVGRGVGRWSNGALIGSVGQRELADSVRLRVIDEVLGQGGNSDGALVGAIEKISGGSPAAALKVLLLDGEERLGVRLAGLVCLVRFEGKAAAEEVVISAEARDEFLENLSFWAAGYDYLPGNMMSFYMCVRQKGMLPAERMAELRRRLALIRQREEYEFDVCDSHLLLGVGGEVLSAGRGELAAEIGRRLGGLAHTKREGSYSGAVDDYREDFAGRCNLFSYTDLLRIRLLLDWLGRSGHTDTVRGFLRADAAERLSEVGGLWFIDNAGSIEFRRYEPGQKAGDNQYIESQELLNDAALCLGRWHCHVDQRPGKGLAGPGSDDISYGRYVHTPMVVITLLNGYDDKIGIRYNVDYLSAGSVVVDLGNY